MMESIREFVGYVVLSDHLFFLYHNEYRNDTEGFIRYLKKIGLCKERDGV